MRYFIVMTEGYTEGGTPFRLSNASESEAFPSLDAIRKQVDRYLYENHTETSSVIYVSNIIELNEEDYKSYKGLP